MPVGPLSIDAVRQRVPQLLQQPLVRRLLGPLRDPTRGVIVATRRWVSWRTVAAAVLLGGIVHICVTFAAAVYTGGHAYRLLRDKLPANRMIVLAQQGPGQQLLPELAPDMLYAMCRYDLSDGPVAVTATVLDAGWALSLHTPLGTNFYVLPGQTARRTDVSFVLVPSGPDATPTSRRESATDTQIASPTIEGLIVLRASLRGLAWAPEAEAILQRATCTPVKQ